MSRSCLNFIIHLLGIATIWIVAVIIASATAGTTAIGALVAAGIITAFAGKSAIVQYNNCRNRR